MNDTSPEIQKILDERYKNMTGEQRFLIGCSMYETARAFVLASLPSELSPKEKAVQLFLRFYGNEFNESEKEKIINSLRS